MMEDMVMQSFHISSNTKCAKISVLITFSFLWFQIFKYVFFFFSKIELNRLMNLLMIKLYDYKIIFIDKW